MFQTTLLMFIAIQILGFATGWIVEGFGPKEQSKNHWEKVLVSFVWLVLLASVGWPLWVGMLMSLSIVLGSVSLWATKHFHVNEDIIYKLTLTFLIFLTPMGYHSLAIFSGLNPKVILGSLLLIAWVFRYIASLEEKEHLPSTNELLTVLVCGMFLLVIPLTAAVQLLF